VTDLNGGHLVARTLQQAGVRHLFTLCGGHILPIYDGCITEGIAVVDMRHEQACAHAGDAYARLTRNIGVAVVTAGPGVTDAVTGVANAYSARSPLLLIGGAAPLGPRDRLNEPVEVGRIGERGTPVHVGAWDRREAVLDHGQQKIHGDLDEDGSRAPGERGADRRGQHLGDLPRLGNGP